MPLFTRALASSWRSLIGWSLGVIAALSLYLPLFASIGGNGQMKDLLASLPPELITSLGYDQISTGSGYTQATYFGLLGFALLMIAATAWGTAAIAGDEETGSLELTLAHGVGRVQVVLERTLAVLVRLAWLGALSCLMVFLLNDSAGLGIDPANIPGMGAAFVGLGLLTATSSIAVGALTGRRAFATAAGAGVAVVGYALNALANQSADLDAMHNFSPYHWAYGASPLANGADWGGLGLLYGLAAVLIAVAAVGLSRRDLVN
ncbi:MAG: ABC transporter permease subunit [Burkholderiaceae bacterium]|nr:ABC transporter permease subunit [Microbacteriaceae bacterium]